MLKYEVDAVPEGLEQYYAQTESGAYRLQVEGVVGEADYAQLKTEVKSFRQKNIDLMKDNQSLNSFKDVFGGGNFTPDGINQKLEAMANSRAESLINELKAKHEEQVNTLTADLNGRKAKLNSLTLSEQIRKAGPKHGVLDSAYDDVMYRAERDFEISDDGVMTLKASKMNAEGKVIATVDDWFADTLKAAPHLAAKSQGTGVTNGIRSKANPASGQDRPSGIAAIAAGLSSSAGKTPALN